MNKSNGAKGLGQHGPDIQTNHPEIAWPDPGEDIKQVEARMHDTQQQEAPRKLNKGHVFAWVLWDWGTPAFNAVTTTFVFTVFLTTPGLFAEGNAATNYLSQGLTISGLVIALLAPIVGQKSDLGGHTVRNLGIFSYLVAACLFCTVFVYPENPLLGKTGAMWFGITVLGVGTILYEFAAVNNNAILVKIATPQTVGRLSSLGWGMGYLGGIVLLAILYMGFIKDNSLSGITHAHSLNIRVAMLIAACWFLISVTPIVVVMGRKKRSEKVENGGAVAESAEYNGSGIRHSGVWGERQDVSQLGFFASVVASYKQLGQTIKLLAKESPNTLKFLFASAIFRDGLVGTFTFGAIMATTVYGLGKGDVLIFGIVSNVVAGVFTVAVGTLDDKLGPKLIMSVSLICMTICGILLFVFHNGGPVVFWSVGLILVIFVGPAQSSSRSYLARIVPEGREGEIFGLYSTCGRAVSFMAPFLFWAFKEIGALFVDDSQYWGILGITLLLFVGMVLVQFVKPASEAVAEMHAKAKA